MLSLIFSALYAVWAWAAPQAFVPVDLHHFGEITEGELFCWEFTLGNVGDTELILGPAAPSCACTSFSVEKERLAPGETILVKVCFDSTGYGGKEVVESLSIRTNDPNRPWVRLALTGYVRPAQPYEAPAKDLLASLYLLLDVRPPEEYARGHLLGALNLPYFELQKFLDALPRGVPIFVYGGEEAEKATEDLRKQGFIARALAGDISGWLSAFGLLFVVGELVPRECKNPEVPSIYPEALAKNFLLILDIRDLALFREGTLPGAIQVDREDLPDILSWLPKAEALPEGVRCTVWVVDEDGGEAGEVAKSLREAGVPAVSLVGGLRNWRARFGSAWLIPPFWASP